MDEPTDYTNSGFDKQLSRGDTPNLGGALDNPGSPSTAQNYDRGQQAGIIGDIIRVGSITLDGVNSTITITSPSDDAKIVVDGVNRRIDVYDTNNKRVTIGQLPDTNFGWAVSKPGVNVENGFQ